MTGLGVQDVPPEADILKVGLLEKQVRWRAACVPRPPECEVQSAVHLSYFAGPIAGAGDEVLAQAAVHPHQQRLALL